MLGSRYGICGNPHTGYPDATYMKASKMGWLRSLVLDPSSFTAMYNQVPTNCNIAAVVTGQTQGLNNDFWSDGWRDRFSAVITSFCESYYKKVRLIEFTNEWDFWDNDDRAEKAAEIAAIGTNICKEYGILGFLGSVASGDWQAELARAIARINQMEAALGYTVVHGFAFHPYMSYVERDDVSSGFKVPNSEGWERLSDKVRNAIQIAGGRICAITEVGIKVGDAGGTTQQGTYVHGVFQDELARLGTDELLMASYFCWVDQNGAPSERGSAAFGLIDEHGVPREALRAATYQLQNASQVDMPVARLLASSKVSQPTPAPEPTPTPIPPVSRVMTLQEAHQTRWQAIVHNAEYHHDFGFEKAWRQASNSWWGSPITETESVLEDGRPLRIFANAVVAYNSGDGTTEVLG